MKKSSDSKYCAIRQDVKIGIINIKNPWTKGVNFPNLDDDEEDLYGWSVFIKKKDDHSNSMPITLYWHTNKKNAEYQAKLLRLAIKKQESKFLKNRG